MDVTYCLLLDLEIWSCLNFWRMSGTGREGGIILLGSKFEIQTFDPTVMDQPKFVGLLSVFKNDNLFAVLSNL